MEVGQGQRAVTSEATKFVDQRHKGRQSDNRERRIQVRKNASERRCTDLLAALPATVSISLGLEGFVDRTTEHNDLQLHHPL